MPSLVPSVVPTSEPSRPADARPGCAATRLGPVGNAGRYRGGKRWLSHASRACARRHRCLGRDVRYLIQGYLRPASVDDEPTDEDRRLVADLTCAFINRTGLIFANSRKQLELLADLAARHAEQERITNRFRITTVPLES